MRRRRPREISFPLGALGTGCIGLAGNGRLVDREIFGKPAKGSVNGLSHIAVRTEHNGFHAGSPCRTLQGKHLIVKESGRFPESHNAGTSNSPEGQVWKSAQILTIIWP